MEKRYQQLDSLRGMAALAVLMSHSIYLSTEIPNLLYYSPLYFFWASHEAVIFFFVLSGFVLSLPFFSKKTIPYREYLVKRICRIYLPYAAAMLATFTLFFFFSRGSITGLGVWFEEKWSRAITAQDLFAHLLLLGNFETGIFNPAIWSLVHELRISLIFPLLVLLVRRYDARVILTLCLLFSMTGGLNNVYQFQPSIGWKTSLFDTLHFTSMFLIGSLLAKHVNTLTDWYKQLSPLQKKVLLLLAFLSYTYSRAVMIVSVKFMVVFADLGISVGAAIFIIASLSSRRFAAFLSGRFLALTGRTSYSLYLFHTPVLFALFHALYGTMPVWLIYVIAIPLIGTVSVGSWLLIEQPAIRLGKGLVQRMGRGSAGRSAHG